MSESTYNTFVRKLGYAFIPAVLFFVVSLPEVYNGTNKLGERLGKSVERLGFESYSGDCPTSVGKFLHSIVFFLLVYGVMTYTKKTNKAYHKSNGVLAKYAFYSTLIFFLLSSSDAYNVSEHYLSGLTNSAGCPNMTGALVHGIVFLVVLTLVMYFPKDSESLQRSD